MAERVYILDDFSLGELSRPGEFIGISGAHTLKGFYNDRGGLRSMEGRKLLNGADCPSDTSDTGCHGFSRLPITITAANGTSKTGVNVIRIGSRVMMDVSAGDTGDWRPIVAKTYSESAAVYFAGRSDGYLEWLTLWDDMLFLTNGHDRQLRFDRVVSTTGSVAHPGTNNQFWHHGSAGEYTDIRVGDIIYLQKTDGTWTDGQIINNKTPGSGDGYFTTYNSVAGIGEICNYIIVRVHRMGIEAATTTTVLNVSAAGCDLTIGATYQFRWRYKNSHTGTTGVGSTPASCTATDSNYGVRVGGWNTNPADKQIDVVEVFQTKSNNYSVFYKVSECPVSTSSLAVGVRDSALDQAALYPALMPADDLRIRPGDGELGPMILHNKRLMARGGVGEEHYLRTSNLLGPEYWPVTQDPDSLVALDPTIGAKIPIGRAGEWIEGMVTEGPSYGSSGRAGSSLLIFTRVGAKRLYGSNWDDWLLSDAFPVGSVAWKSVASSGGRIYWMSNSGPYSVAYGSCAPAPIYEPECELFWPENYNPSATWIAPCTTGAFWNGYYILSFRDAGSGWVTLMYSEKKGTFIRPPDGITPDDYCIYDGSNGAGELYYSDYTAGRVYKLFAMNGANTYWTGTTGVESDWWSGIQSFADKPGGELQVVRLSSAVLVLNIDGTQSLRFRVYREGEENTPIFDTEDMAILPDPGYRRRTLVWLRNLAGVDGRSLSFRVSGTFNRRSELLKVVLYVDPDVTGLHPEEIIGG